MQAIDFTLKDDTPWRHYLPEEAKKDWAVLWLQGFKSTISRHDEGVRRMSEASRVPFAMLDYAGHGDHPVLLEDATRAQQFAEALEVYDQLQRQYSKIIVIGGSFGGYLTALLAGERQPLAVILRAPAQYSDEEFELPLRETSYGQKNKDMYSYRRAIDENSTNRAIEGIRSFTGDVYVIENEKDEVIPPAIPRSYYNAAQRGNYIVIPGLKHSPQLMENSKEYHEVIERWIATIIFTVTKELR